MKKYFKDVSSKESWKKEWPRYTNLSMEWSFCTGSKSRKSLTEIYKPVRADRNQQLPISPWFILRLGKYFHFGYFALISPTCSFSCLPWSASRTTPSPSLSTSHRSREVEAKPGPRGLSASAAIGTCRRRTSRHFPGTPSSAHCSSGPGSGSSQTHSSCPWWLCYSCSVFVFLLLLQNHRSLEHPCCCVCKHH